MHVPCATQHWDSRDKTANPSNADNIESDGLHGAKFHRKAGDGVWGRVGPGGAVVTMHAGEWGRQSSPRWVSAKPPAGGQAVGGVPRAWSEWAVVAAALSAKGAGEERSRFQPGPLAPRGRW